MDATKPLAGLAVLVLEDDYYLADDTSYTLETAGARVVGPCPTKTEALALSEHETPDCAIVDINLGQGPTYDTARTLLARGVRVILVTGYDREAMPADLQALPWLSKPTNASALVTEVARSCGR